MRSFFTNYEAGGLASPPQRRSHLRSFSLYLSSQSVAFNDLLLLNCLTNYLSEEKKVDGNQ